MDLPASLQKFEDNWGQSPIIHEDDNVFVLKLYVTHRDESTFQEGRRNTVEMMIQRTDLFESITFKKDDIDRASKCISFENFTLSGSLRVFAGLQNISKKNLSLTDALPQAVAADQTEVLNFPKFKNYLDHLSKVKIIKTKTSKVVKDKFDVSNDTDVTTSALFSNLGYIVKGFEGKYLSLSKGDRTFIKNFINEQISEGAYKLTVVETLPLYRESIKEILKIGKKLLALTGNKTQLKAFSSQNLDEVRSSLEGCWQLYFEKYLRVMLMTYKEFYPEQVFKKIDGYDKDCRPDFLAVDIYNNIDVIEIKTHRTILFRKEKNRDSYYPSADLNKSIFQLNKYLDLKSENIDSSKITGEYTRSLIENDKVYRPRGLLIISSLAHISSEATNDELTARLEKEIKKIKTTYHNIDIILFDELLNNLENYVQYLDVNLNRNEE